MEVRVLSSASLEPSGGDAFVHARFPGAWLCPVFKTDVLHGRQVCYFLGMKLALAVLLAFSPLAASAQSISDLQGFAPKKPPAPPEINPSASTLASPVKIKVVVLVDGEEPYAGTVKADIINRLGALGDIAVVDKGTGEDLTVHCVVLPERDKGGAVVLAIESYAVTSQIYNKFGRYSVSQVSMSSQSALAIDKAFLNPGVLVDHFISASILDGLDDSVGKDLAKINGHDIEQVRKFYLSMAN